ncbi:unnamed protein product, partial [Ectocarpus sp. 13 AM-2016]
MEGSRKKTELCSQHAKGEMVDVTHKRCGRPGCTKWPSYGVEGGSEKAEFCFQHAVDVVSKRCSHQRLNQSCAIQFAERNCKTR